MSVDPPLDVLHIQYLEWHGHGVLDDTFRLADFSELGFGEIALAHLCSQCSSRCIWKKRCRTYRAYVVSILSTGSVFGRKDVEGHIVLENISDLQKTSSSGTGDASDPLAQTLREKVEVDFQMKLLETASKDEFRGSTAQNTHIVGDGFGWPAVPQNDGFYVKWASQQKFHVNDVLLFNFATGAHTVAEVTKEAYNKCDGQNPISLAITSPAKLTINTPGDRFYICTTIGPHCNFFLKLAIKVVG
ncbi:hypothetical protein OSB04_021201 [Centaurea solstitialis]|uniref:Phytocyanin domain-containing protein n=1 Tax=Centaurea solstitialis TaxID=347529 RepID=A0AA38T1G1_9ASTR|nr:hypothetical protein OSB04_021201 [Centaurea solstitialis]